MSDDKPLLVFFTSQRSGPARRMESLLAHLARKERMRVRVMRVEVEAQPELAEKFRDLAKTLAKNEDQIVKELTDIQGEPVEIGGYYRPDLEKVTAAMRPSKTLNEALESATK